MTGHRVRYLEVMLTPEPVEIWLVDQDGFRLRLGAHEVVGDFGRAMRTLNAGELTWDPEGVLQ